MRACILWSWFDLTRVVALGTQMLAIFIGAWNAGETSTCWEPPPITDTISYTPFFSTRGHVTSLVFATLVVISSMYIFVVGMWTMCCTDTPPIIKILHAGNMLVTLGVVISTIISTTTIWSICIEIIFDPGDNWEKTKARVKDKFEDWEADRYTFLQWSAILSPCLLVLTLAMTYYGNKK